MSQNKYADGSYAERIRLKKLELAEYDVFTIAEFRLRIGIAFQRRHVYPHGGDGYGRTDGRSWSKVTF